MGRWVKSRWALAAIAVAVLGGLWITSGNGQAERIVYSTVAVDKGDILRIVTASGKVSALITVEVGSQLSGQVAELHADFNTEVEAGQMIALIDPKTYQARVRQAQAELEVARANLAIQKASQVAEQATLRQTELDFERKRQLAAKGHVSQAELEIARAALDTATARLQMNKAQITNAKAAIKERAAGLFQAQVDLDRTQIRAPVDGVVIERNVDVGQTVAASLSSPVLFKIAQDLRSMQVEANIDEADIGNIREGNDVSFAVDAYPDRKFGGRVAQIRKAPLVAENVVTYMAIISTRNDDLALLPGMTANVEIITGRRENVLRVANAALRFRPKNASAAKPGASGGSGGGGMADKMVERLSRQLELSAKQQTALRAALAKQMRSANTGAARPSAPAAGGDHAGGGMLAQFERILGDILSNDQMALYRQAASAQRGRRGPQRRGQLWLVDDDGRLTAKSVRLGLSDDDFTEVLGGEVSLGDQVISRARTVTGDRS